MEQPIWRLDWNDSLSVGIPEIDKEHQNFISLINGLNLAIADRMELSEIRKRMQLILDDWNVHFAHEEALFKQWHYPDADQHAKRHEQVTRQLNAILAGFSEKSLGYEGIAVGLKVKEMLINHMLNEDMKYRDYYRSMPR